MKRLVLRSVTWSTLAAAPTSLINYAATIILARLLTPEIFGQFSFVIIIFQYISLAENPGLQSAFIQSREKPEKMAGTFLLLNLSIGLSLFALANLTAPAMAAFFRAAHYPALMRWVSLSFLFNSTALVQGAWLSKSMDFKRKFFPQTLSALISSGAGVALAATGHGLAGLVARHVLLSLLSALFLFLASPRSFPLAFDKKVALSLFRFALPFHSIIILGFLRMNVDYLVVGKLLGPESLGLYRLAFNTVSLPVYKLSLAVASIAFPALSLLQSKEREFRDWFAQIFRIHLGFTAVLSGLLLAVPESLVLTFLGEKWGAAAQPIRILTLFIFLRSLTALFFEGYKAKAFLKVRILLAALEIGVLVPLLIVGCRFGIVGVAAAHLAAYLPFFVLEFILGRKYFGIRWQDLVSASKKIVGPQFLMLGLFLLLKMLVPQAHPSYHPLVAFGSLILAGLYYLIYWNSIRLESGE